MNDTKYLVMSCRTDQD